MKKCFLLVILWIKPLNFDKVNLPKKITQKRICGYDYDDKIPDDSTFSRAFSEFAEMNICEKHHNYLIENHYQLVTKDKQIFEINYTDTMQGFIKRIKTSFKYLRITGRISNNNPIVINLLDVSD